MSYGNKYKIDYIVPADANNAAIPQTLYIQEKDYSGAVEALQGTKHGISITHNWKDWETHILGTTCEFDIVNDKSDYFELLDLMYATDKKYMVVIDGGVQGILFEGFINVEVSEQKYLHKQTISLTASSYLARLKYIELPFNTALTTLSFIDIIDGVLRETGIERDIWVSHSWYNKETVPEAGKTTFNTTGIFLETFWKNNVEKQDGFKVLSEILKTFNSYLFFEGNHWYIIEYDLIWNGSRDYVIYTTGNSYTPLDSGGTGTISPVVRNLSSLQFTSKSQNLAVQPGCKQIEIKSDLQKFDNLALNDFSQITLTSTIKPFPLLRRWMAFVDIPTFIWGNYGEPYATIENSIRRVLTANYNSTSKVNRGIYTKFQITVDDTNSLSIKWKQTLYLPNTINWNDVTEVTITTVFRYYLQIVDYKNDTKFYTIDQHANEPTNWFINDLGAFYDNKITSIINLEQLKDMKISSTGHFIVEPSVSVPLHDVNKIADPANLLRGNYTFVLGIGIEYTSYEGKLNGNKFKIEGGYASEMWIGDVNLKTDGDTQPDNLLRGKANLDFVNTKKLDLSISDIPSLNYKNGILTGFENGEFKQRTTAWTRPSALLFVKPLDEMIMLDKWRQYNTTKQILTGTIFQNTLLSILAMYIETLNNDKKFVIMGFVYKPTRGMYEVTLMEYDNETQINLI